MPAIPWQTTAAPANPLAASAAPTFPSGASWSQGSPGWDAYLTGQQQNYANANAQYPTGSLPTGTTATGGGYTLDPAQLAQWQNYFQSGAGGAGAAGGTPGYTTENVQTGSQYSPTIPWLTGGAGIGGIIGGSGATNANTSLALPWQSLGITPSSDPATMAANINASPYAGSNPSDPYYSLILNQAGQGGQTPTYTQEQVPTGAAGGGGQWAQMVGGQLIGNPTPQEQQLAGYFGLNPGQVQYLPDMVNAVAAAPPGSLTSATVPMFNANVLQQAGGTGGLTPQEQANYLRSLSGVGNS